MLIKLISIIPLIIFLISDISIGQHQKLETSLYFNDFQYIEDSKFFLFSDQNAFIGSIFDNSTGRITPRLIPSGRGPFEIEYLAGFAYDGISSKLYVTNYSNGRIIQFDKEGVPLRENTLPFQYIINLDAYNNDLVIAPGILLGKETVKNKNDNYPIGYTLNPDNLEITDTLHFDLSLLDFENMKDLDKIDIFEIRPKIISLKQNGFFLISFQSHNTLYLYNKETKRIEKSLQMNIPNFRGISINYNKEIEMYGQRIPPILDDYVRVKNTIYFSFSSTSKNLPLGLIEVHINDQTNMTYKIWQVQWNNDEPFEHYVITTDGKQIYGTDGTDIIPLTFKEYKQN